MTLVPAALNQQFSNPTIFLGAQTPLETQKVRYPQEIGWYSQSLQPSFLTQIALNYIRVLLHPCCAHMGVGGIN